MLKYVATNNGCASQYKTRTNPLIIDIFGECFKPV